MSVPFQVGVLQLSMEPVEETVEMAVACDEAGFDSFWLAEAYPWWRKHSFEARSSTSASALCAKETENINIGWGIVSPYTRHPVQLAMEARVLQDYADGRFLLGLGASKIFMKHAGEGETGITASPATTMREAVEIIESVLAGENVDYSGEAFTAELPPLRDDTECGAREVPLYFGATGPVLQKMAGEITDGLLTASITTPGFVEYSRGNLEEGAREGGKDPEDVDLGSVIVGSVHETDSDKGKQGAREMASMYLANKVQNIRGSADKILENAGLTFDEIEPIAEAMERGGRKAAAEAVTDSVLEKVSPIAGTPTECIDRIKEFKDAGCTHILLEIWGDNRPEQARIFGEKVLPHV